MARALSTRSETIQSIGLMLLAMAAFAVGDASIKAASGALPPGQIVACIGFGGLLIFVPLCWRSGARILDPAFLSPSVLWRNTGEIVAVMGFTTALSLVPLSLATSIFQATPLLLTLGAALILRERVGLWRWGAVVAGFAGVLLILRPGADTFDINALWAILPVVGLAIRDLSSRIVPRRLPTILLAVWGFGVLFPSGLIAMWATGRGVAMDGRALGLMILATVTGALGYWAVTAAMRLGDVSAVAPYRYTRLIFTLFLAVIFLGERPDIATLSGATIIVAAGLVTLWREGRTRSH